MHFDARIGICLVRGSDFVWWRLNKTNRAKIIRPDIEMFSAGILDINSCFIKYNQATFTVVMRFLFTVVQGYVSELSVHVFRSLFHCSWCPDFYNLILLIYYLMTMAMTLNLKKRVQSWNNKTWARFWGSDLGNQHLLVPSIWVELCIFLVHHTYGKCCHIWVAWNSAS